MTVSNEQPIDAASCEITNVPLPEIGTGNIKPNSKPCGEQSISKEKPNANPGSSAVQRSIRRGNQGKTITKANEKRLATSKEQRIVAAGCVNTSVPLPEIRTGNIKPNSKPCGEKSIASAICEIDAASCEITNVPEIRTDNINTNSKPCGKQSIAGANIATIKISNAGADSVNENVPTTDE